MGIRRSRVASTVLAAVLGSSFLISAPARAADPASSAAAAKAVAWIVTQQQSDGGFEVAGFPGFETPDAVLAIAEAAQTGSNWSTSRALAAVLALEHGGAGGPTPLDALDDFVDAGVHAGQAAKLVVLVVGPLGLDPTDFDPSGDSGTAIDLTTIIDPLGCAGNPATYGFFNATLYGALAKGLLCGTANPAVVATIRAAQRADGGWNYLGDPDDVPDPVDSDVDTTALAVQALVARGASWNAPAITAGLAYLSTQQSATGSFPAFGSDDPNATAVAMLAVAAAGFDPSRSCWRDTVAPVKAGSAYMDPGAWLRAQQDPDGHVAGPNDGFGLNTFATSQSVEAWLRSWLPVATSPGAPDCTPVTAPAGGSAPDPVELTPRFTG